MVTKIVLAVGSFLQNFWWGLVGLAVLGRGFIPAYAGQSGTASEMGYTGARYALGG